MMSTKRSVWLALGIAVLCGPLGCASGSTPATSPAVAKVTIVRLTPPAGTEIGRDTVLVADVQYSILGFSADSTYSLVPLFLATDGRTTFNNLPVAAAPYALRKPEGTIQVEYPIAGEWDSGKLAKPVVLSYYVLQKTGAHQARGIGGSEKIQFSAKPD